MGKYVKPGKSFLLYATLLACSFSLPVYSQNEPVPQPEPGAPLFPELNEKDLQPEEEKKDFFSFLDKPQKVISSGVERFAKATDEFFADEKVFYETSGSYMKLTAEVNFLEGGEKAYYTDLKLKIKLPVTEKKASLLIESNPAEEEEEIEKALQNTPREAVSDKDYFAGVQTTIGEKQTWQFKPSGGIKLGAPLDYYARFRLTKEVPLSSGSFQFKEALYWFNSTGWESDTAGEYNYQVLDNLLFRSTTGVNWLEEPEEDALDDTTLRQIFSLTHKLSERRAISYQLRFDGITEPTIHTTKYSLLAHYRQNLHADYLFMDLIPTITYLKENDFRADYSFIFRLEMVFKR